jgi:prolyl oligopeptidase
VEGALSMIEVAPDFNGLVVEATAWTRAREIYEVARDGTVRNTGLQPLGPFDSSTDCRCG